MTKTMTVTSIKCVSNGSGHKTFLTYQSDGGIPIRYPAVSHQEMDAGDYMDLPDDGIVVDYDYSLLLSLWNQDFIISNVNEPSFLVNTYADVHTTSFTTTPTNLNGDAYEIAVSIAGS